MSAQLDHLVIAAATLAEGMAWCEATLAVVPEPGGEHALFGTHNRLLKLNGASAPSAYLEIIAINPRVEPLRAAPLKRWFDLDQPALRQSLLVNGPQLIQWVASVPAIEIAVSSWQRLGIQPGPPLTASRPTAAGQLEWQISVRDDGQRLLNGCLPTLIEWGEVHPGQSLPNSGVTLNSLRLQHPEAPQLDMALTAIGMASVRVTAGSPTLIAELNTPCGAVTLRSIHTSPQP